MKKIKNITIESILYLYIILCPILDCLSFIFRKIFETSISPSTVIRPICTLVVCLYIFITDKKQRKIFTLSGLAYGIYAIVHLYIFTTVKNGSSYSGIIHELQYLVNYTFAILNLYAYLYVFTRDNNMENLNKCMLISISIYIISIYLAIITGTSSYTYSLEKIGYKGWFESGNSLSAIMTLSMFIILNTFEKKKINLKIKKYSVILILLIGIFMIFLIGTRVGALGFLLSIGIYGVLHIIYNLINRKKIRKTLIITGIISGLAILTFVAIFTTIGSEVLSRRKKVEEMANELIDETTKEKIYITGDLYQIKKQIENDTIEPEYMSNEQKQAVLSLNEFAEKHNLSTEKMRTLQLIYNIKLINNQSNLIYNLFGNGYVCQYREMILEMEFFAIIINFGLLGFILYLMPFISIYVYSVYRGFKNIKKIDIEYIMLAVGGGLAFVLSVLSGYIFFNASTTMIIIITNVLLINKAKGMKEI